MKTNTNNNKEKKTLNAEESSHTENKSAAATAPEKNETGVEISNKSNEMAVNQNNIEINQVTIEEFKVYTSKLLDEIDYDVFLNATQIKKEEAKPKRPKKMRNRDILRLLEDVFLIDECKEEVKKEHKKEIKKIAQNLTQKIINFELKKDSEELLRRQILINNDRRNKINSVIKERALHQAYFHVLSLIESEMEQVYYSKVRNRRGKKYKDLSWESVNTIINRTKEFKIENGNVNKFPAKFEEFDDLFKEKENIDVPDGNDKCFDYLK